MPTSEHDGAGTGAGRHGLERSGRVGRLVGSSGPMRIRLPVRVVPAFLRCVLHPYRVERIPGLASQLKDVLAAVLSAVKPSVVPSYSTQACSRFSAARAERVTPSGIFAHKHNRVQTPSCEELEGTQWARTSGSIHDSRVSDRAVPEPDTHRSWPRPTRLG